MCHDGRSGTLQPAADPSQDSLIAGCVKREPLSFELQVACEIYHHNLKKEPIWFSRLAEIFKRPTHDVSRAIDVLFDWMIITGHYGETCKGHAGYVFELDMDYGGMCIPELYEKYWKGLK